MIECKLIRIPKTQEDDLKWVEENIPADFGEGDLPALDSEEVNNTIFYFLFIGPNIISDRIFTNICF